MIAVYSHDAAAASIMQCKSAAEAKEVSYDALQVCNEIGEAHWESNFVRSVAYGWMSFGLIKLPDISQIAFVS